MKGSRIDFAELGRRLLDAADRLVPQWLPHGRRNGAEWTAPNPLRDDRHVGSFSVNLVTGAWADFATGDKGGDLISLYAYLFHGGRQGEAARELGEEMGMDPTAPASAAPPAAAKRPRSVWTPVAPVSADAADPPAAHVKRGRPECRWEYRSVDGALLGYVCRFRTSDGGKEILPLVWARSEAGEAAWRWMQWPEPRPLYGLDRLRPDRTILIVEGEKCADAGHKALGEWLDVLSWPGGGNAVSKADWTPLVGRKVVIWPDCDAQFDKRSQQMLPEHEQPGIVAAERIAQILVSSGCDVRIVRIPPPGEKPGGWDIADAIQEGASAADLQAMLRDLRLPRRDADEPPPVEQAGAEAEPAPRSAARASRKKRQETSGWERRLLERRGEIVACLANVALVLGNRPEWEGVIAHDAFAVRTVKRRPLPGSDDGETGEWTDVDTSRAIIWLTNEYGMTPGAAPVDEAVELIARANSFHPVREYLARLEWDGVPRIDEWLSDFLGVPRSEYSTRVSRWYLMGMVGRVMSPGSKFDYCLVLEGRQGRQKSSALRVLAGEYFSETDLDLSSKDAMSALRGKWLHEVAEMGSLARAESSRQKSFLSRQIDEFRPAYARREIRSPRQLVFAGTTNEWSWNKDPTGGRRFWPVEVADAIDTVALSSVRDQLFAEALVVWRTGARYWPTSEEQQQIFDPVQLARESEDGLFDKVHDWLETLNREEFTMGEVLEDALKLDAGRITRDVTTRAGQLLHKMGCGKRERRNGVVRFVYTLPAWTPYAKAQAVKQQMEASDGISLPL